MALRFDACLSPLAPSLISEIAALSEQIFDAPGIDYAWRLTRMPQASVFVARDEERLVGFKAGYAIAEGKYYSWLGAIHPASRRQGIAGRLARMQHEWLHECGYASVETSCRQGNEAMTRVNLASGFTIVGTKLEPHGLQVLWAKRWVTASGARGVEAGTA